MAFNLKTFQTRAGTAAIFVVVMVLGLCWNVISFFTLFSVIHFGCWFEYFRMMAKTDAAYARVSYWHRFGFMLAGWAFLLWLAPAISGSSFQLHDTALWVGGLGILLILISVFTSPSFAFRQLAISAFGLVYISFSLGLMQDLFHYPLKKIASALNMDFSSLLPAGSLIQYGWLVPAIIIATIWINDTMAYIVGSLIGKHPLSPISPKKTWEGTMGGIVLAIVVTGLICSTLDLRFTADPEQSVRISRGVWFWLAGVVAISGTIGDLLESKLKRMAGVKDSGSFMPGHGGFLDRFDSLLLAVPFAWLLLFFL